MAKSKIVKRDIKKKGKKVDITPALEVAVEESVKNEVQKIKQVSLPAPKLAWHGALMLIQNRVFKIKDPHGYGTGFHIGNFGDDGKLCAVATAYHVIQQAHDWGEPLKVIHVQTGREILLKESDRGIFTYANKDLAIILFNLPDDLKLPPNQIDLIPTNSYLYPGVDIAWCGFPNFRSDNLCFFHGYISCYDTLGDYLIDGVVINGVSGGPVFYVDDHTNQPKVAGVITAYIPNRSGGNTLPGVGMITSVAPYEETIKSLQNLSQAKKEADEQKTEDQKPPETQIDKE